MRELPNSFLRTGVIVGHPDESEAEFEELCEFLQEVSFDRVNAFAYSDEEDTKAYEMENKIDKKTISKRLKTIEKILKKSFKNSLKDRVGKEIDIIIEGESSEHELFFGSRELCWAVGIDGEILINDVEIDSPIEVGKCYRAKVTQLAGDKLLATITATL